MTEERRKVLRDSIANEFITVYCVPTEKEIIELLADSEALEGVTEIAKRHVMGSFEIQVATRSDAELSDFASKIVRAAAHNGPKTDPSGGNDDSADE